MNKTFGYIERYLLLNHIIFENMKILSVDKLIYSNIIYHTP